MSRTATVLFILVLLFTSVFASAQSTATLRGEVTDQLGGGIPGASVIVLDASGKQVQAALSDAIGAYRIAGLPAGTYTVKVSAPSFETLMMPNVKLAVGQSQTLALKLSIATEQQKVTVNAETQNIDTDPTNNKSAMVLENKDLESLPDDPDDLASALTALAGPSAGPNGAQIYVDGFTGGSFLPDKNSIKQIIINQNPFSSEYERIGFGRIEIITKPGYGKVHGSVAYNFNGDFLNAQNPFATSKPSYQRRNLETNLSGPLVKDKVSYFLGFSRRDITDVAIISASTLDSTFQNILPLSQSITQPKTLWSTNSRIDWQATKNQTFNVRYNYNSNTLNNQGIGGFSLPSRENNAFNDEGQLQVSLNSIINTHTINDFGYQWERGYNSSQAVNPLLPGLNVQDGFTSGGSPVGSASSIRYENEVRDYITLSHGKHTIKFGGRFRTESLNDVSPSNFNGTYTFAGGVAPVLDASNNPIPGQSTFITGIEAYRRTLLLHSLGKTAQQIRQAGGGLSQFLLSGGNPLAQVSQYDFGVFLQDDWRVKPNLTLSFGLRYQHQDNIHDAKDWAPRLSFAWSPGSSGKTQSKTVIRGGAGIFYDLVRWNLFLNTQHYNGTNLTQFVVKDQSILDTFTDYTFRTAPALASLSSGLQPLTTWRYPSDFLAPYYLQSSLGVERALSKTTTLTATYLFTHGEHQLRAVNINSPATGVYQPGQPTPLALNKYPLGTSDVDYEYTSNGIYRQNMVVFSLNTRPMPKISINANYSLGWAKNNTDGSGSFPSDVYNITQDYGRASNDVRSRFILFGNMDLKWGFSASPFLIANSGAPFNITNGIDNNGDSIYTDRPAFATDLSRRSVVTNKLGSFDTMPYGGFVNVGGVLTQIPALANPVIIPRNFGNGSSFFSINLRVVKSFSFGPETKGPAGDAGAGGGGGGGFPRGAGGGGGDRGPGSGGMPGMGGGGPRGGGGGGGAAASSRPYRLQFQIYATNLLNHSNFSSPIGNLSSGLFGQSNSINGGFGGGGGQSGTTSNRAITLRAQFSF